MLLVVLLGSLPSVLGAGGGLAPTYFGFWGPDAPSEMRDFTNLAFASSPEEAVSNAAHGIHSLLKLHDIFVNQSVRWHHHLNDDYATRWASAAPGLAPLIANGSCLGFFLGDELGVANGTRTDPVAERLRWAATRLRRDFPTVVIYVNALCATLTGNQKCSAAQAGAGHWSSWIGASNISWISQDFYTGGDDAPADQADYEKYLFPFLRPDQVPSRASERYCSSAAHGL